MSDFNNKNKGVLFPNKSENDKAPDFTGTYTDATGKEFRIAAWKKVSKQGQSFLSMSFEPKDGSVEATAKPVGKKKVEDPFA